MSMLTSFYNNNQFVSKLTTLYITDEILLKLYYKLDYFSFHYIFWIYKKFTIFNKQIILFAEILIYNDYFKKVSHNIENPSDNFQKTEIKLIKNNNYFKDSWYTPDSIPNNSIYIQQREPPPRDSLSPDDSIFAQQRESPPRDFPSQSQ